MDSLLSSSLFNDRMWRSAGVFGRLQPKQDTPNCGCYSKKLLFGSHLYCGCHSFLSCGLLCLSSSVWQSVASVTKLLAVMAVASVVVAWPTLA